MDKALDTWCRKLEYLEQKRAEEADPARQFQLDEQIYECKERIQETQAWRVLLKLAKATAEMLEEGQLADYEMEDDSDW